MLEMRKSYEEIYSDIWDVASKISVQIKNKIVKGIHTKRILKHEGGKYKWRTGEEITFTGGAVFFKCGFWKYYEDSNDYEEKNLLVETKHYVSDLEGVDKKDLLDYLRGKLRVVKIEMLISSSKNQPPSKIYSV